MSSHEKKRASVRMQTQSITVSHLIDCHWAAASRKCAADICCTTSAMREPLHSPSACIRKA